MKKYTDRLTDACLRVYTRMHRHKNFAGLFLTAFPPPRPATACKTGPFVGKAGKRKATVSRSTHSVDHSLVQKTLSAPDTVLSVVVVNLCLLSKLSWVSKSLQVV